MKPSFSSASTKPKSNMATKNIISNVNMIPPKQLPISAFYQSSMNVRAISHTQQRTQPISLEQLYKDANHLKEESLVNPTFISSSSSDKNKSNYDLEKSLQFEVKSLQSHLKLTGEEHVFPVMVSIKTEDQKCNFQLEPKQSAKQEQLQRLTLDLICVIDISSSMKGEKIKNVQNTLQQLIDMLGSEDRVSLILFNSSSFMLCNLRKLEDKNKQQIKQMIRMIPCQGGTNIFLGLKMAFDILQSRKTQNQVSSIFLLSDGQDKAADQQIQYYLKNNNIRNTNFTIHSFGFGNDHDGPLMNAISSYRDGNFYYVENIYQVDEFFIDALGGLFSVVAQDVEISVVLNENDHIFKTYFNGSKITRTYGKMWNVVQYGSKYNIKINQLFSGVSKDYIFEITVPKKQAVTKIEDYERNLELIKASLTAVPLDILHSTKIVKENTFNLTLYSKYETIAQESSHVNHNVEFNYIRVNAASAMEQAISYSEQRQYDKGKEILEYCLFQIQNAHPSNKERLSVLKRDILECQQNANPKVYEQNGRFRMLNKQTANYSQQSQALGNADLYQNNIQRALVMQQRNQKRN